MWSRLARPDIAEFRAFNPAYAEVQNQHVWAVAWADIIQGGMTPQAAADKAFKRIEAIFAKYPIAQAEGITERPPVSARRGRGA